MTEVPDWMIDYSQQQGCIFELLAKELPKGWSVQIDLEKDSGSVSLFWPNDALTEIPVDAPMELVLKKALAFAKFQDEQSDMAVDKAWHRFCKAMNAPNAKLSGALD